ncbi:MAG: hypothetical protein K2W96_08525, partial [Gemmataceae bacterium]|nr:hypothetical protein [Gemmataceae bacterium]
LEKHSRHPALGRVQARLERLLLVRPRWPWAYEQLGHLLQARSDAKALAKLSRRAAVAGPDVSDSIRASKEALEGKKDARRHEQAKHGLRRAEKALEACRKIKGPTHAAAACAVSAFVLGLAFHDGTVDLGRAVELAEEGHAAAPSDGTRSALAAALVFRGHARLRGSVPEYAALCKKLDRPLGTTLVNWVLLHGGPLAAKVAADEDIKKARQIRAEQSRLMPGQRGPKTWAFLKGSHPKEATLIAARVKKDGVEAEQAALQLLLSPHSPTAAMDRYFALELLGKKLEATALLLEKKRAGVPLPEAP